jgi:hypothetical protein
VQPVRAGELAVVGGVRVAVAAERVDALLVGHDEQDVAWPALR